MKTIILFSVLITSYNACAQNGTWVWMKGADTLNSTGNYGELGIPSPTNEPPARENMDFWTDTAGNFWLYGGDIANDTGYVLYYCDLWKFDPTILMWTWMSGCNVNDSLITYPFDGEEFYSPVINAPKGVYDVGNYPGSTYGGFTWITVDNHLWFYNSYLWQYDPSINQWAYMGLFGPNAKYGILGVPDTSNWPGERGNAGTNWVDSAGNLWLFGGDVGGLTVRNDLWEYNVSTGIWTWISGTDSIDSYGHYGTIGIPSANDYPWSRATYLGWKDNLGNFWLAGGAFNNSFLQDVWEFSPHNLEWTWVSGSDIVPDNDSATGTQCDTNYLNIEGARYGNSAVWKVCDNLILNYGGEKEFGPGQTYYNDVWGYVPSIKEWVKVSQVPSTGWSYGIQDIASPLNYPYARVNSAGFVDKSGSLWMFGGSITEFYLPYSYVYCFNDLWKYTVDSSCIPIPACSVITGIKEMENNIMPLNIYPNPASSFTIVQYQNNQPATSLAIYNCLGQLVQQQPVTSSNQQIDVSHLAAGLYLVCIKNEQAVIASAKLVKE